MGSVSILAMGCPWQSHSIDVGTNPAVRIAGALQSGRRGDQEGNRHADPRSASADLRSRRMHAAQVTIHSSRERGRCVAINHPDSKAIGAEYRYTKKRLSEAMRFGAAWRADHRCFRSAEACLACARPAARVSWHAHAAYALCSCFCRVR
jgi:hypothetical protein